METITVSQLKGVVAGTLENKILHAVVVDRTDVTKFKNADNVERRTFWASIADPTGSFLVQCVNEQMKTIFTPGKSIRFSGSLKTDGTMLIVNGQTDKVMRNSQIRNVTPEQLANVPAITTMTNQAPTQRGTSPLKMIKSMTVSHNRSMATFLNIHGKVIKKRNIATVPVKKRGMTEMVEVINIRMRDETGVSGVGLWRNLAPVAANLSVGAEVEITNVLPAEFEGQKGVSTTATSEINVLSAGTFINVPILDEYPDNVGTVIEIEGVTTMIPYPKCTGNGAGCRKRLKEGADGLMECSGCNEHYARDDAALGISGNVLIAYGGQVGVEASIFNQEIVDLLPEYDLEDMLFGEYTGDVLLSLVAEALPISVRVNLVKRNDLIISEIYAHV